MIINTNPPRKAGPEAVIVAIVGAVVLVFIVALVSIAIGMSRHAEAERIQQEQQQRSRANTAAGTASVTAPASDGYSVTGHDLPEAPPDLEILDESASGNGFGGMTISGHVRNNTAHSLSLVQIEFACYDGTGARTGSAMDIINDLGPGETWNFKATCFDRDASKYKLSHLRSMR